MGHNTFLYAFEKARGLDELDGTEMLTEKRLTEIIAKYDSKEMKISEAFKDGGLEPLCWLEKSRRPSD